VILPLVSCGCEIWFVGTVWKEVRLKMLENKFQGEYLDLMQKVTGWRKLHKIELPYFYS
jgi:hypothetical protein